jgi:hypothetical protein
MQTRPAPGTGQEERGSFIAIHLESQLPSLPSTVPPASHSGQGALSRTGVELATPGIPVTLV